MEKNLFKNKNVLWTVMNRLANDPEAKWSWLAFNSKAARVSSPLERSPSEIYFYIFVITCCNQLIDKKIYIIKNEMPKNAAGRSKIRRTKQLAKFFLYTFAAFRK